MLAAINYYSLYVQGKHNSCYTMVIYINTVDICAIMLIFRKGCVYRYFCCDVSPCIACTTPRYLSLNNDTGDLFPGLAEGEGPRLRDLTEQELCSGGGACLSSGKLSLSSEPSEEVLWKNTINVSMFCSTYSDLHLFCTKCLSHSNISMYHFHTLPGTHVNYQ